MPVLVATLRSTAVTINGTFLGLISWWMSVPLSSHFIKNFVRLYQRFSAMCPCLLQLKQRGDWSYLTVVGSPVDRIVYWSSPVPLCLNVMLVTGCCCSSDINHLVH